MRLAMYLALFISFIAQLNSAKGERILNDDFDDWNSSQWRIPTWIPSGGTFLGRTQLHVSQQAWRPSCDGVLTLTLDTYNPTALTPGDSFFGSEIISQMSFQPPEDQESYSFSARFRLPPPAIPGGMVASMFLYQAGIVTTHRDEVDAYELLTSQPGGVSTNVYKQASFSDPGEWIFHFVDDFDLTDWHTMTLLWTADSLVWSLDGQDIRSLTGSGIPTDQAMNLRFNLWAPSDTWADAYDAGFQPVDNEAANHIYEYELDWVQVDYTVPEPTTFLLLCIGGHLLNRRRRCFCH